MELGKIEKKWSGQFSKNCNEKVDKLIICKLELIDIDLSL